MSIYFLEKILSRIGSKLATLRRATLKHFYGVGFMTLHLVGSLLRHQDLFDRFSSQNGPKKHEKACRLRLTLILISRTTPLLNFLVRLWLANKSNKGRSMRESVVNITAYLNAISKLYQESFKEKKGELLQHAELVTQRSRKQLIKRLSQIKSNDGSPPLKRPGKPSTYSKNEILPHIQYLWGQMENISSERMKAALPDWLPKYKSCPPHLKFQLEKMSASTLKRYLKGVRLSMTPSKGLSTTYPARYMQNKVPINTLDSKVKRPGYVQVDTVAHCGNSSQGPFVSSLTITDIHTTWTECRAMLTKKGPEVRRQANSISRSIPFKLLSMNSDSGSEFLNKEILPFTHLSGILFTRSRPYKKNDNCYVEQKNFTHVRELFGYERFDSPRQVNLMNEIYKNYWNPLQIFFSPPLNSKKKYEWGLRLKRKPPHQNLWVNGGSGSLPSV